MVSRKSPRHMLRVTAAAGCVFTICQTASLHAAPVTNSWTGTAGTDFENAANWSALPTNDLTSAVGLFSGAPGTNQPVLTADRSIAGLQFTTSSGGWTLGANPATATLSLGSSGVSGPGQLSGTNTISANLRVAAAQTWSAGSNCTVIFTGSISGPDGYALSINASTQKGTVIWSPATGKTVTLGGSNTTAMLLSARQGGLLMLGGDGVRAPVTDSINTIKGNGTYGALAVTGGGAVEVNSGTWNFGDVGRNSSGDYFSGSLTVNGGTISFDGARFLAGGTITVNGGTLRAANTNSLYSNGGKFALGSVASTGTAVLQVRGGFVDLAQANGAVSGGNSVGVGMNARVVQTGGTLQNGVTLGGGTTNTLTIGHSGLTSSGSGTTITYTATNILASYTLSGGTLISAGAIQGTAPANPGTNGTGSVSPGTVVQPGASNVRNFNFLGGVLAVASVNTTNLGYASATGLAGGAPNADPEANSVGLGTFYNHGGTLSPGGEGTAGKTTIGGGYTVLGGALAVDLGGTNQATAFRTGEYDFLSVSGAVSLGGNLVLNVLPGFTPNTNQTFTILDATGGLSGAFANAPFGSRIASTDGRHTFVVSQSGNTVRLGDYRATIPPSVVASSAPGQALPGGYAVLSVTVESQTPVTYEWRRNGTLIEGATSSALALGSVQMSDSGTYEVTIRNAAGSTTKTFPLLVLPSSTSGSVVVDAGASETFAAVPGAASYRWLLDGVEVGNSATFTYSPTSQAVGTHWLRVIETYSDGSKTGREWSVRVRLQAPVATINYYVSPTGSDTNNGSIGTPFATLEKARDTIRSLRSSGDPLPAGGVRVHLRGGVYRRTATFKLDERDSGDPGAPVVYAAYPGETPILTGASAVASAQIAQLATSEQFRLPTGIDPKQVWEFTVPDKTGDTTANKDNYTFPGIFNEWWIYNAFRSTYNGGFFELFYNGARQPLSRYPNNDPSDDALTPSLTMNGVATGTATDGSGYLNGAGTYTASDGSTNAVGGAFHFKPEDAAHIERWKTALSRGGVWLAGYWRVPWQLNGVKVGLIDTENKQAIALASSAAVPGGIGDKYTRPVGNKKEPYYAINLLEELDTPGEWCVDFSRKKIYFYSGSSTPPADGAIELSSLRAPLVQLSYSSDIIFEGIQFRRQLGQAVQIYDGTRDLLVGCTFRQNGNVAVDIDGGMDNGVVSGNFDDLAAGGIMMRGGLVQTGVGGTPILTPAGHFAVNNRFRGFGRVVRVYQGAVDAGSGGPFGTSSQTCVGTRIAHNDIRDTPHGGIYWGSYSQTIEYNELSDFVRTSNDMGAIYRFGTNYESKSVIRYNHAYRSPQGEAFYFDSDRVGVAVYGNVANLQTPSTAARGYGFYTTTGSKAVPGLPMTLSLYNNIAVNSRVNYRIQSAVGATIENNLACRSLSSNYTWQRITTDTNSYANTVTTSDAATLGSGPNKEYASDPGFIDLTGGDLRLRPDAQALRDMPNFVSIPLEMSGLYNDEYRSDARVWTPFIRTDAASALGANSASFNGTLVYPQFEKNTTVRIYWGTIDGGTDPNAWQNSADLGKPSAGQVSYLPTALTPGTRYYYRFYATNSAGEHWSEKSNSTTTYPLSASPSGGTAEADSGIASASNAFDGNAATAWSTDGATTGALTYRLPGAAAAIVTRYTVTSASGSAAADPRDWVFEGSYDGINWITLDTRTGQTFETRGQMRTYGFASTTAFPMYRLRVTANNGDASALQIAELGLSGPDLAPDTTGPVISTPGNRTVAGATAAGAYVDFEVSAVDAVSGNAVATATPPSGSLFPIGNTTVTVTASDAAGNKSTASFVITVTQPQLPAPWSIQQIQPFAGVEAGTATANSATSFTVNGRGGSTSGGATGDMWSGTNDSFTYVSVPWQGDGTFTARIASFTSDDVSAKAGIAFRETTSTGSRYSAIYLLQKGDAYSQHKTATSGSTSSNFITSASTGRGIPQWIRLVRTGDTFRCYYSSDGTSWTELGSARSNIMGSSSLSVGLIVAPRTGNKTAAATFDNISFLTPRQGWRQTNFGTTANQGTAADNADPDGDGCNNLVEYSAGTSPTSALSRPPASSALVSFEPDFARYLALTFQRIADPMLTYTVEGASDLGAGVWEPIWHSSGAANVAGSVTVTDGVTVDSVLHPRRFMRLRVTSP